MSMVCIVIARAEFHCVDGCGKPRYGPAMSNSDTVFDALRELVNMSNPGLITKADLSRLESRLEELGLLLDEIEARVFESPPSDEATLEMPSQASASISDDFDDSLQ